MSSRNACRFLLYNRLTITDYDIVRYSLHAKHGRDIYVKSYIDYVEALPSTSLHCEIVNWSI